MNRETFKVMRELFGPQRMLLFLMVPVGLFVTGYMNGGPSISSRMAGGLLTLLPFPVLLVAVHFYVKLRYSRLFAPFDLARDQLNAMTAEQIRTAAQSAIETTPFFRAHPSTSSVDPRLPPGVVDFFGVYDRLDFVQPGNPSPYLSICRSLMGPVPNNDDALKIGEMYMQDSCIAVHLTTERITTHQPPIRRGEVARCGELPSIRYLSVWHFVALMAAYQRIGDEVGHRQVVRHKLLDNRPRWRAGPSRV